MNRKQHRLSRKYQDSNLRHKLLRVVILHEKMANAREKFQEKISPKLVQENQVIVVEKLAVSNLVKKNLSQKSSDGCWSILTR
ncbi:MULTISPECIES: transposase [unclassified Microcoleus]|uniref:transposase n=1 Tax=unclassified Microcoleus TaxID=2642155 RepID=UPI00403F66DE